MQGLTGHDEPSIATKDFPSAEVLELIFAPEALASLIVGSQRMLAMLMELMGEAGRDWTHAAAIGTGFLCVAQVMRKNIVVFVGLQQRLQWHYRPQ